MPTLLLIEDEKDIREPLARHFKAEGYTVLEAGSGEHGLELARKHLPDIVLLDIMLPGMDGLGVCRELNAARQTEPIPVIFLTARGTEVDRIVGFELGAADYVVKPFSLREVALRVRSVLRLKQAGEARGNHAVSVGPLTLDPQRHDVTLLGKPIHLTATEFTILHDLMLHRDMVRNREQILSGVWGGDFDGFTRTVDAHVKKLREKLHPCGHLIETVRGIGYKLVHRDEN